MANDTAHLPPTASAVHGYLLGESSRNVLIRLALILTGITTAWCCIICVTIARSQHRHRRDSHRRLYESTSRVTHHRLAPARRVHSSSVMISSAKWETLQRAFVQMKQRCSFWTVINETAAHRTASPQQRNYRGNTASVHAMKTHAAIEAMTRRVIIAESSAPRYHSMQQPKKTPLLHKKNSIEPLAPSTTNVPLPAVSVRGSFSSSRIHFCSLVKTRHIASSCVD